MEQEFAEKLSKDLQIHINNIVREYWEMVILNELYASSLAESLIFKGGTALRLLYGSPRFSEDLDFSLLHPIDFSLFKKQIEHLSKSQPELSIGEIFEKRQTIFALLQMKGDLPQTLSIKIEISKRNHSLRKGRDFTLMTATSPTTNLTPLLNVYTREHILREKCEILKTRAKARDFFDIWFLEEILHREHTKGLKTSLSPQEIKRELHRLLPTPYHRMVSEIMAYAKNK